MSGNKWIHHHALKISTDKWSCQISSRDINSDPYTHWTSSFTVWSLLLPSLFVAKRPKHIKFRRACYGAWSTMAGWAVKCQQMNSPVGWAVAETSQPCCRQDFCRLPSCTLFSGGTFGISVVCHFIFPFACSLWFLIQLGSTRLVGREEIPQ